MPHMWGTLYVCPWLQLTIEANDNQVNPRTASGVLTVSVTRNSGPPVFSNNGNYFQTIDETQQVGTSVLVVTATDQDSNVGAQNNLHDCN